MKRIIKENLWFFISLIIISILFNIKLPYYINMPGGTIETNNRISCKKCSDINGSINLLYVSETEATVPTFIMSHFIPNWDLEKISNQQVNNESPEEIYNRNRLMLEESIDAATMVAYKKAERSLKIKNKKTIIIATTNNNNLKIGDEILKVDEKEIENLTDIRKIINSKNKNDKLIIKILRNNKEMDVTVKVREEKKVKLIGVIVATDYDYEINPKISLKFKSSEAGASGGLMLALSIYSKISNDDIIKGRKIAGTGTIDSDGNVGEIDGIKYKIMGAHKEKIDLVLVPVANYKEAIKTKKENNYKMEIVKIKTFNEAIEYLK